MCFANPLLVSFSESQANCGPSSEPNFNDFQTKPAKSCQFETPEASEPT